MTASAPSGPSAATLTTSSSPAKAEQSSSPSPAPSGEASEASVYAIVETSGQQFWLQPNRYLDIDRLDAEVGASVSLNTVLLVKGSKGTTLGQPYVNGASVELQVIEIGRAHV